MIDWALIQQHTIDIYDLKAHPCQLQTVSARSLLCPGRFDLFAKLYYLKHRQDSTQEALAVYESHIKAFNPDGREPGRKDKNGVTDFVAAFDLLYQQLSTEGFDNNISLIPVDEDGIILDGAHRTAILASLNKEVTVARFEGVHAHRFDYHYFKKRGLSWDICDTIAQEMTNWLGNAYAACLWPRLGGKNTNRAIEWIAARHHVIYEKPLRFNLLSATRFVKAIYNHQPWTRHEASVKDKSLRILGNNRKATIVFFTSSLSLDRILEEKNELRDLFGLDKDSLHITDNVEETRQIAHLCLTREGQALWQTHSNSSSQLIAESLDERWQYFKNITWINVKRCIWRIIHFKFK